jgi:signal transduction histidine kinase
LYYSLYVISFWFFFLGDSNYDFEWLYPHWPHLATISPAVYSLVFCLFMLLFMSEFLYLKSTYTKLFFLSRIWTIVLLGAILMLTVAYSFSTNIDLRFAAFYYCLIAAVGAWAIQVFCVGRRIRDKYRPAYLYGIALIGVFVAALIYVLHSMNVFPDIFPNFIYLSFAFSGEIFILSFALMYSYAYFKSRNEELSMTLVRQKLEFGQQLLQVQEIEQKRIAEDLHDELGGNLAALKINLQSMEVPREDESLLVKLIDKAIESARYIAHNLMPPEFAKAKLTELVQNYFDKLNRDGMINFNFFSTGKNDHFNKQDELIIYRIILELTHNIIKHSYATESTIQMIYYDGHVEIMAEDNGRGIVSAHEDGIGLRNVRSRVNYLMGEFRIDSSDLGTTIMISLPYKK